MEFPSVRPADDVEQVLNQYGDHIYRICLITLKNEADAEDAVQETLIRYMQRRPRFDNATHEKAWLIRVAVNLCRDMLRKRRYHEEETDCIAAPEENEQYRAILDALLTLPEPFRVPVTLHYVEGYSVAELADILGKTQSAIKMRLSKGRQLLREAYGKEQNHG